MELEAIMFVLIFTLHNMEEALWLPEWTQKNIPNGSGLMAIFTEALRLPQWKQKGNSSSNRLSIRDSFLFADLGITVLGYLAVGLFVLFPDNLYTEFIYIGLVGAMMLNTIVPHLLLTIKYRKYCPGLFTGCFLFIPINTIILIRAYHDHMKVSEIIVSVAVIGIILLVSIPLFTKIAEKLLDFKHYI